MQTKLTLKNVVLFRFLYFIFYNMFISFIYYPIHRCCTSNKKKYDVKQRCSTTGRRKKAHNHQLAEQCNFNEQVKNEITLGCARARTSP